jgi:hypothetical protein
LTAIYGFFSATTNAPPDLAALTETAARYGITIIGPSPAP